MKPQQTVLTLADEPQELENHWGSGSGLEYPTAARLRTQLKGDHGVPAERLRRSYTVEPSGCWRWIKGITGSGYGHFWVDGAYFQAHIVVYILERGNPPLGLQPDHLCRNHWCVSPNCIEWVTAAVNCQRGDQAVLSPEQVAEIKRRGKAAGVRAMAREYGVNHSTISRLLAGRTWVEPRVSVAA